MVPYTTSSAPVAQNIDYNGSSQYLITSGSTSSGTLYYRLGTSGGWDTSRPQATDVGNYTVQYYISGDSNHYDSGVITLYPTINTRDVSTSGISIYYSSSNMFNGLTIKPNITVTIAD